jgi:hypothetical protein
MPRLLPLVVVALLVAGCGSEPRPIPPARAAPPQAADLNWVESYGEAGARLVFGVQRFEVLGSGWRAKISLTNRTSVRYAVSDPDSTLAQQFGLMLFQSGDLRQLEQLNRAGELPAVRRAEVFHPALPLVLKPGQTWRGVISAPGALAAGRWVRVVFGMLAPIGNSPRGLPEQLIWITDHAYQLEG